MADNVNITPGSGVLISTEEVTTLNTGSVSAQQVQRMIPSLRIADSTAIDFPGDLGNGVDVDVTRVKPDGTNTMPSLDAAARAGFVKLTDGSLTAGLVDETGASAVDAAAVGGGTPNDSVDSGNPIKVGGYAKAAAPADVSADGDRVAAWFLRNGAQATALTAAGALVGGDATNGLDVDVTRVKPDGTNVMPSMDVAARAAFTKMTDGTNMMPSMDAAARAGFVKLTDGTLSAGLVDETGTSAVDAQAVGGGTPHDSVNSGNPLLIGGEAIAHGTNPTAVAAGDRTKQYYNRAGVPFVIGGHPKVITYGMSITTGATNAIIGPTIGSGLILVVTRLQVVLDNASTVFPSVVIGFATATTPAFATTPGTAQVLAGHPGVPAGGGFTVGDGSGIVGMGADGEELRITTVGTAGGNGLYVTFSGYTIES